MMTSEKTRYAVRNLRLCTKDCLCLYVCPTGASDTENSIIDPEKCIGCGACAEACPSKAISMMPLDLPPQQPKAPAVIERADELARSKAKTEARLRALAERAEDEGLGKLAAALARATRFVAEDLMREAGFMLPQSANAHMLLEALVADPPADDFPMDAARRLLELIPANEPAPDGTSDGGTAEPDAAATPPGDAAAGIRTYRCLMCGATFSVSPGVEPVCPVCGATADYLELIEGPTGT